MLIFLYFKGIFTVLWCGYFIVIVANRVICHSQYSNNRGNQLTGPLLVLYRHR